MISKSELENIVRETYKKVYAYCLVLSADKNVAEDLTQETFLVLSRKAQTLENEEDKIEHWLMKVAKYEYMTYRDKKKRENHIMIFDSENMAYFEALNEAFDRKLIAEITYEHIEKIFKHLSKKESILFELYFFRGLSYKELEQRYKIKRKALYTRISRLKTKVAKIIEDEILFV